LLHAELPKPAPGRDYIDARAQFAALAAPEGAIISSAGRSRFLGHGRRTPLAVVLIHGFTNCPQQWMAFASTLHAQGHTVVIPRLPGHGYFDRRTTALARVSAQSLVTKVNAAVDIARGAGERVAVAGLSIGATLACWVALQRDDVARAVAISPFFAVKGYGVAGTRRLARVLGAVPNVFLPWDPFGDGSQIPSYGYPKFATRMLGECLDLAGDVVGDLAGRRWPIGHPFHGRTVFALNGNEPACNNAVAVLARRRLERSRPETTRLFVWNDLPKNHDIIDPTNPLARTGLVYPRLRELLLD
jgi:carboxylesterase